jgi:hypothetical protein
VEVSVGVDVFVGVGVFVGVNDPQMAAGVEKACEECPPRQSTQV